MLKQYKFLIVIGVLGFILRVVGLASNPPSLNWDEISHGYNAYSLLKTGMDQWGQKMPIFNFRAYGDYPTTLNLYLTIPFVAFLGLSEFAIRIPHAILGTLTIVSVYFFGIGLTKQKRIGLLAAFLVAIGPWYLFTSRFVLQSNLSVFLLVTAASLFVNREKNRRYLPLSLFLLFLTLFSYHTTRIFSPIFLMVNLFLYKKEIKNKFVYLFASIFIIISAYILIIPSSTARGNQLFLLDRGAISKIEEQRNKSALPKPIVKFLYNRPVYFTQRFVKNYVSYFSPQFLFFYGGTQYQFSLPGFGLSSWLNLPFFYIGLILLISKIFSQKYIQGINDYKLILVWLLLSPIPASLTNETFTVLRASTMLPLPEILISIGFYWVLEKINNHQKVFTSLVYIILLLIWTESYLFKYFTSYKTNYSWSWQWGYKEVVEYTYKNNYKYDYIVVTKKYGEPHEYFLFYLKYDPSKYLADANKIAFAKDNWWWVDRFDKYWFINDWQVYLDPLDISGIQKSFVTESGKIVDCRDAKCLLVTSPGNVPPGWSKIKSIDFLDSKPAFELYEN